LADPADQDLAKCDEMVAACFASDDFKEGRRAFMEKRKPRFEGR
jgi:enoyl-CoA hydratase